MEEIEVDVESEQGKKDTVEDDTTDSPETNICKDKESPNQKQKLLRLPLARIKAMMKKDLDSGIISQDAVFLVTKATEMFIEYLASESEKQLAIMGKRKTVMKKDVDHVIQNYPQLCFLDGALD